MRMECPYCYAYVYDQLCRPVPHRNTFLFAPLVNLERGMKDPHPFVSNFIRASKDPKEIGHVALMFTEAGGVSRPKRMRIQPLLVARMWVVEKLKEIGDVDSVHFLHSGGFEPQPLSLTFSIT
jgi:hypothetical protein